MIDIFFKIIDKVIDLMRYREARSKATFDNHIVPLFESLGKIVDDYRKILDDAILKTEDDSTSLDDVISMLDSRRKSLERARQELNSYSRALGKASDGSELAVFAKNCLQVISTAVDDYEPLANGITRPGRIVTGMTNLISSLKSISSLPDPLQKKLCVNHIKQFRSELDRRFKLTQDDFFRLRIKSIGL